MVHLQHKMSTAQQDDQPPFRLGQAFASKQALAEAAKIQVATEGYEFYAHRSDNTNYDI